MNEKRRRTLAHQYLDQLEEDLRYAILGNVGTLIVFRLGARDATLLAKEFSPEFSETDLVALPEHHIYLKLMVDGTTTRPFSGATFQDPRPAETQREQIIAESRRRYGRPAAEVDGEIIRGWSSGSSVNQLRLGI